MFFRTYGDFKWDSGLQIPDYQQRKTYIVILLPLRFDIT